MEQKGLVKSNMNLPGFVEHAYESVEQMEKFANLLLGSKLCPDHFYEKGGDGKVDYAKGKTEAVVMVLLQGHQLQLPPLTALQHIIPVNGLLSVKGDAAKSMIFGSGLLKHDTWKEEVTGDLSSGTYKVTITATRKDSGQTLTRSFSVEDAKRAGLWISEDMLRKQDGWKYKKSAWYKYPSRMIAYRALGFLARDLFPDVLSGIYTTEEAMDLPKDETLIIETERGATLQIADKDFDQSRSKSLTSKVAEKIDKRNGPEKKEHEATPLSEERYPATPEESYPAAEKEPPTPEKYTEDELKEMDIDDLREIIHSNDLEKHLETIPGKNTNKKLRNLILAAQENPGELANYLVQFDSNYSSEALIDNAVQENEQEDEPGYDGPEPDPEEPSDTEPEEELTNKFHIDVPDLVDGKRSFDQVKSLFEELTNVAGIDNKAFESLINTKFPQFQHYRIKEDFCYKGEKSEINTLLNSIE